MFNRLFGGGQSKTVAPVSAKTSENVVGAIQGLAEVINLNFFLLFHSLFTLPKCIILSTKVYQFSHSKSFYQKPAARRVA
jgi:hypothetical protein